MSESSLIPKGERLRKAVRWLGEQPHKDARTVEEASRRFDLTPGEEEFLLRHFKTEPGSDAPQ